MPRKNVRYRVKTLSSGKRIRLAFKKGSNKTLEVSDFDTGKVLQSNGKSSKRGKRKQKGSRY